MAIDISENIFKEEDLGPLKLAQTTNEEYIPGMREQGKGVTISCPHDYGVLKTAIVGNAGLVFIPDPDQPEMHNLLRRQAPRSSWISCASTRASTWRCPSRNITKR